jgi:hypothetical protein
VLKSKSKDLEIEKTKFKPPLGKLPNKFKLSNLGLEVILKGRNA